MARFVGGRGTALVSSLDGSRRIVATAQFLGAVLSVAVCLMMSVPPTEGSVAHSTVNVTLTAPFHGAAHHNQRLSHYGCGHARGSPRPFFNFTNGEFGFNGSSVATDAQDPSEAELEEECQED